MIKQASILNLIESQRALEMHVANAFDADHAKRARHEYVSDLRRAWLAGERPDLIRDPWLTAEDIAYITDNVCGICERHNCQCDAIFQQNVDNELSEGSKERADE